jgi:hypothetical protein
VDQLLTILQTELLLLAFPTPSVTVDATAGAAEAAETGTASAYLYVLFLHTMEVVCAASELARTVHDSLMRLYTAPAASPSGMADMTVTLAPICIVDALSRSFLCNLLPTLGTVWSMPTARAALSTVPHLLVTPSLPSHGKLMQSMVEKGQYAGSSRLTLLCEAFVEAVKHLNTLNQLLASPVTFSPTGVPIVGKPAACVGYRYVRNVHVVESSHPLKSGGGSSAGGRGGDRDVDVDGAGLDRGSDSKVPTTIISVPGATKITVVFDPRCDTSGTGVVVSVGVPSAPASATHTVQGSPAASVGAGPSVGVSASPVAASAAAPPAHDAAAPLPASTSPEGFSSGAVALAPIVAPPAVDSATLSSAVLSPTSVVSTPNSGGVPRVLRRTRSRRGSLPGSLLGMRVPEVMSQVAEDAPDAAMEEDRGVAVHRPFDGSDADIGDAADMSVLQTTPFAGGADQMDTPPVVASVAVGGVGGSGSLRSPPMPSPGRRAAPRLTGGDFSRGSSALAMAALDASAVHALQLSPEVHTPFSGPVDLDAPTPRSSVHSVASGGGGASPAGHGVPAAWPRRHRGTPDSARLVQDQPFVQAAMAHPPSFSSPASGVGSTAGTSTAAASSAMLLPLLSPSVLNSTTCRAFGGRVHGSGGGGEGGAPCFPSAPLDFHSSSVAVAVHRTRPSSPLDPRQPPWGYRVFVAATVPVPAPVTSALQDIQHTLTFVASSIMTAMLAPTMPRTFVPLSLFGPRGRAGSDARGRAHRRSRSSDAAVPGSTDKHMPRSIVGIQRSDSQRVGSTASTSVSATAGHSSHGSLPQALVSLEVFSASKSQVRSATAASTGAAAAAAGASALPTAATGVADGIAQDSSGKSKAAALTAAVSTTSQTTAAVPDAVPGTPPRTPKAQTRRMHMSMSTGRQREHDPVGTVPPHVGGNLTVATPGSPLQQPNLFSPIRGGVFIPPIAPSRVVLRRKLRFRGSTDDGNSDGASDSNDDDDDGEDGDVMPSPTALDDMRPLLLPATSGRAKDDASLVKVVGLHAPSGGTQRLRRFSENVAFDTRRQPQETIVNSVVGLGHKLGLGLRIDGEALAKSKEKELPSVHTRRIPFSGDVSADSPFADADESEHNTSTNSAESVFDAESPVSSHSALSLVDHHHHRPHSTSHLRLRDDSMASRMRDTSVEHHSGIALARDVHARGLSTQLPTFGTAMSVGEWCTSPVVVGGWDRRAWFRRSQTLRGVSSKPLWSGCPKDFLKALVSPPAASTASEGATRVFVASSPSNACFTPRVTRETVVLCLASLWLLLLVWP